MRWDRTTYVDPSYSPAPAYQNYGEIQSAYPDANELGATYDGNASAGYDGGGTDRGEYVFGLPAPADASPVTVTAATVTATAVKTFTSAPTSHTVSASYVTQYTSASTWNSPPAVLAGPSAQTFTTASTGPSVPVSWNAASWLQSAYSSYASSMSVRLANADEAGSVPFVEFGPNPVLSFTYTQPAPAVPAGTGPAPSATFLSFPVSDRAALRVNAGSGNALLTTSDLTLPEAGSALVLGSDYNSLLTGTAVNTGADRNGWRQREGADVRLYLGSDGTVTLLGKDGTAGTFTAPAGGGTVYGSPAVFRATLTTAVTSPCAGAAYQTAFSYNASGQETQVAYTPRGASGPAGTVTASWTGSYLTGLTESGGPAGTRTVTYGINGAGDLATIRQPDGTTLTLGYDGSHNLTSVQNGAGAATAITCDSAGRATSVTQPYGSGSATATTRLSYVSATETQAAAPTTNQAQPVSSVPNTTYTVNSQALVTKTVDPAGNTRSATYTPFDDVASYTSGAGGGTAGTHTSNSGESLNASQGPTGTTTGLAYTGGTSTLTVSYAYDGAGNLHARTGPSGTTTWTYDGRNQVLTRNAASGGGTLAYGYDADGNLASAADAGGTTAYAYNTLGQLASLTDPAGKLWEFAYNADGMRTTTWFATNTAETTWAMKTVTGYDRGGRISRIQAYRNSSTANVVSDVSYCHSPYVSGTACPTAQGHHRQGPTQDTNSYLASPANGNRYAYAADNPINYTDPTGMCSLDSIVSYASGILGGGIITGGVGYASFFTEASVPVVLGTTGLVGGGVLLAGGAVALGICLFG